MARDIAVGDAACDPHDAAAGVAAPAVVREALADQLHDPRLVAVGDRERFAARGVAVGVGQLDDCADGLACRAGALERDVDQRTVVDAARGVGQLGTAAVGGFGDDERVLVHVADRVERLGRLRYVAEEAARIPVVDGEFGARTVASGRGVVECAVEPVRVGGVGDHDRTVGRGAARDDEVGASLGGDERGRAAQGEQQRTEEFFHCAEINYLCKDNKIA